MRTEYKVFGVIAAALAIAAVVYAWWTSGGHGHPEWAGALTLGLSAVMSLMCAGYFWLVSRRIPPRPDDRPDAEIADGAGPVGFFAPSGMWQVGIAVSVSAGAVGVAVSQWWLLIVAVVGLLITASGLVLEFYAGEASSR